LKLAITGAAGFLGGRLCALAAERGHDVTGVVRPQHDVALDSVVRADLGEDRADLNFTGFDAVLHAAGRVDWGTPAEFARDNPDATGEVARACAAAGVRMVHVSTTAVYGDRAPETGRVTEDSALGYRVDALDRYATSKIDAELRLRAFEGLDAVVIRPGFIIGPKDRNTAPLRGLIQLPVTPLVGRGSNRLPLTYVDSVADAILRAAEVPEAAGRAYNIAGDWSITQRGFYLALAAAVNASPRFLPVPYRAWFSAGRVVEELATRIGASPPWSRSAAALLGLDADVPADRARAELGWSPACSLTEAIAAAVA
jgi:2-alkyl-3-oxoalkanoate reductase